MKSCSFPLPLRGAELFEAKVKKLVAARLEMEKKSVQTLKKQYKHFNFAVLTVNE